jgi:hypothetical protein
MEKYKPKDVIRIWAKIYGLLLLNVFKNYVWVKVLFILLMIFDNLLIGHKLDWTGYRTVALGIGIFMALDTTYVVEGTRTRVWRKEFGVFLDDKKDGE